MLVISRRHDLPGLHLNLRPKPGIIGVRLCHSKPNHNFKSTTPQASFSSCAAAHNDPDPRPSLSLATSHILALLAFSMASKTDKIEKIIARLQDRIGEGQYYEAQQQTRVVAARYIKAKNWDAAIDILSSVSQSLLKAGQGGSGGDLCVLLVDVYKQAELKPDAASKGRLLTCLRLFEAGEPTRKKFVDQMLA